MSEALSLWRRPERVPIRKVPARRAPATGADLRAFERRLDALVAFQARNQVEKALPPGASRADVGSMTWKAYVDRKFSALVEAEAAATGSPWFEATLSVAETSAGKAWIAERFSVAYRGQYPAIEVLRRNGSNFPLAKRDETAPAEPDACDAHSAANEFLQQYRTKHPDATAADALEALARFRPRVWAAVHGKAT